MGDFTDICQKIGSRKRSSSAVLAARAWENGGRLIFPTLCEEEIAEPLPKNIATIA